MKKYKIIIISILGSAIIWQQAGAVQNNASLRKLSFREAEQDRGGSGHEESPPGETRPYSANEMWLDILGSPDRIFAERIRDLAKEVDEVFLEVLLEEKRDFIKRFSQRYEAATLAVAQTGYAREKGVSYSAKIGIMEKGLSQALKTVEADFKQRYQGKTPPLDISIMEKLPTTCMPWSLKHNRELLKAIGGGIDKAFFERLAGEGYDYNQFLAEIFWVLLSECRLKKGHFENEEAYNRFIALLFKYKFGRGEINEIYFDAAGDEKQQVALEVQRRLNSRFGLTEGNALPVHLLELFGKAHPPQHWSTESSGRVDRIYDPFHHTFNAASGLITVRFKNRKSLRLAVLLHDISKGTMKITYRGHPEKSAEMVKATLEEWGLKISEEERGLVELLVRTHADLGSIRSDIPELGPAEIVARLKPPPALARFIDHATLIKMHRRIYVADVTSIPGFIRKHIKPGTMNESTLQTAFLATIAEIEKKHSDVIKYLLSAEYQNDAEWMKPVSDWCRVRNIPLDFFFAQLSNWFADLNLEYDPFEENAIKLAANIGIFDPNDDAAVAAFINFLEEAFTRFVDTRETALPPAVINESGPSIPAQPAHFEESLREATEEYGIGGDVENRVQGLRQALMGIIDGVIKERLGECEVVAIGSHVRQTYNPEQMDFDFDVLTHDKKASEFDIEYIGSRIYNELIKCRELSSFIKDFRRRRGLKTDQSLEYRIFPQIRGLSGTHLISVSIANRPIVEVMVSQNPEIEIKGKVYNEAFNGQLKALDARQKERYFRNVRLAKDFIRNYLKRSPRMGCLGKGFIIEQLVMQSGRCGENWLEVLEPGSFQQALEFIYQQSFDGEGYMRNFEEVKGSLRVWDIAHMKLDPALRINLLDGITKEEWEMLAKAARRFKNFEKRNIHWNLFMLAGQYTVAPHYLRPIRKDETKLTRNILTCI